MTGKRTFRVLFVLFLVVVTGCSTGSDVVQNSTNTHQASVDEIYAIYDRIFLQYLDEVTQDMGKEVIRVEPISDRFTIPKKITISGTPYEIGKTIGRIADLYNLAPPGLSSENENLNIGYISMYEKLYPQYLELLRGIGTAFGLNVDEMDLAFMEFKFFEDLWGGLLRYSDFFNLTDFSRYGDIGPSHNCSVTSYNAGGNHLVGRNFDNSSERPHYFADTKMEGCYRSMGNVIYFLYHWVVDGINEKGLSINVASNGGDYQLKEPYLGVPAVFSGHMARIVMDTCGTVDEALDKIGSVRIWFPNEGIHWLIADASGRSVIVEFDHSKKMVVFNRSGPYELITNTALQHGDEYVLQNCWRFSGLKPILEQGISNMTEMRNMMETARFTEYDVRTLWTSIMDLNNLSFEISYLKEYDRIYRFSFYD